MRGADGDADPCVSTASTALQHILKHPAAVWILRHRGADALGDVQHQRLHVAAELQVPVAQGHEHCVSVLVGYVLPERFARVPPKVIELLCVGPRQLLVLVGTRVTRQVWQGIIAKASGESEPVWADLSGLMQQMESRGERTDRAFADDLLRPHHRISCLTAANRHPSAVHSPST